MKYILLLPVCAFLFLSCETDVQNAELVVGSDYVEIDNRIILIDTLTVDVSTINFDSLVTSGQSRILLGNYDDPIYGKLKSESYFQLLPENLELDDGNSNTEVPNYVFDSIAMILRYDKYHYGDTTNIQTISVHRLTQRVKPNVDDKNFYNSSTLTYDAAPIGSRSFYPRPNEKDSLNITLDNSFGNQLFLKLKNNEVTDLDELVNYFKGVVVKPTASASANIIGFATTSVMRLYYSKQNNSSEEESLFKDFEISDLSKQFNNISLDRSGGILQGLPASNSKLPSELTDNNAYIQSGSGIACRIDFPHIRELKYISEKGIIVDAELEIKPVRNSYSTLFPIKDSLKVYIADNLNRISGILANQDGTSRFALLNKTPDEFNENIGYKINIRTFLHKEMMKTSGKKLSLVLTYPNISKGVDRIVLGNQNKTESKLRLKIYYISY